MSEQDNFLGGFLFGAIVGGVAGGILGAVVASRLTSAEDPSAEEPFSKLEDKTKPRRKSLRAPSERSIEVARRGLEDKIAQLNDAIDNVRQQLSSVNGNAAEDDDAIARDPSDRP